MTRLASRMQFIEQAPTRLASRAPRPAQAILEDVAVVIDRRFPGDVAQVAPLAAQAIGRLLAAPDETPIATEWLARQLARLAEPQGTPYWALGAVVVLHQAAAASLEVTDRHLEGALRCVRPSVASELEVAVMLGEHPACTPRVFAGVLELLRVRLDVEAPLASLLDSPATPRMFQSNRVRVKSWAMIREGPAQMASALAEVWLQDATVGEWASLRDWLGAPSTAGALADRMLKVLGARPIEAAFGLADQDLRELARRRPELLPPGMADALQQRAQRSPRPPATRVTVWEDDRAWAAGPEKTEELLPPGAAPIVTDLAFEPGRVGTVYRLHATVDHLPVGTLVISVHVVRFGRAMQVSAVTETGHVLSIEEDELLADATVIGVAPHITSYRYQSREQLDADVARGLFGPSFAGIRDMTAAAPAA